MTDATLGGAVGKGIWWAIEISKALLPLVVAALGIWIAWHQMRTAKRKLRLDLFEKRFEVYSFFDEFTYHLMAFSDSRKVDDGWGRFESMRESASMLFGEDVAKLVDHVERAAEGVANAKRDKDPDGRPQKQALDDAQERLRRAMMPLLSFADIR